MQIAEVSAPQNLNEALSFYKRFPNVVPASGCTSLMLESSNKSISIISLHNIQELHKIAKTDRFIEFGAGVTLSRILQIPNIPQLFPLQKAIETIGTFSTRNLATIGGNLFVNGTGTLFPILVLLDANCELRTFNTIKTIKIYDLIKPQNKSMLPDSFIITKIRIPLEYSWQVFLFAKNSTNTFPDPETVLLALTADFLDSNCTNMRIMIHDGRVIRVRPVELYLIGKEFPLAGEEIETTLSIFSDLLIEQNFSKTQQYFFIENLINYLSNIPGD
ncbi:MAG TPA: FAD binding domain-containing protein [Spirochaetales bacterium]|nr:FAD binding domain-containing protein [Spirochaetales bacterium]HPD80997.1 FAD binding domain-containing protein [Spirochaetales bacterium]HQK35734.1 FAD binding domain-containing protein [Spirochaetales bacterium]HRV29751.1 FAD binding domain-containing protein [Spirochaetia bacterium]